MTKAKKLTTNLFYVANMTTKTCTLRFIAFGSH